MKIDWEKAEAMAERLRDIQPDIHVTVHPVFYLPDTAEQIDLISKIVIILRFHHFTDIIKDFWQLFFIAVPFAEIQPLGMRDRRRRKDFFQIFQQDRLDIAALQSD